MYSLASAAQANKSVYITTVREGVPEAVSYFDPRAIEKFASIGLFNAAWHVTPQSPHDTRSHVFALGKDIHESSHLVRKKIAKVVYFLPNAKGKMPGANMDSCVICIPASTYTRVIGIDADGYKKDFPLLAKSLDNYALAVSLRLECAIEGLGCETAEQKAAAKKFNVMDRSRLSPADVADVRDAKVAKIWREMAPLMEGALYHVGAILSPQADYKAQKESIEKLKKLALSLIGTDAALALAAREVMRGLASYLDKNNVRLAHDAYLASTEIIAAERARRQAEMENARAVVTHKPAYRAPASGRKPVPSGGIVYTGSQVDLPAFDPGSAQQQYVQQAAAKHQPQRGDVAGPNPG